MPMAIALLANSVAMAGSSFHTESPRPLRTTSRSFVGSLSGMCSLIGSMRLGRLGHRAQVLELGERRHRAAGGEEVDAVLEALVRRAQHVVGAAVEQRRHGSDVADRAHLAEERLGFLHLHFFLEG